MPTKAEQTRKTVLENAHLDEEEIARLAGTSLRDVLRILDAVEAPARREPVPQQEKRTALPRSSHRIPVVRYKVVAPEPAPKPRPAPPTGGNPRGFNGRAPAQHGTESGYNALHTRFKEPACDECREAMRKRAERRRHDALQKFSSELEATLASSHRLPGRRTMVPVECDCGSWHIRAQGSLTVSGKTA